MANQFSKPKTRVCATCGGEYHLNPRYSSAQADRSRFCSYRCSGLAVPRQRRSLSDRLVPGARFGRLTYLREGEDYKFANGANMRRGKFRCDCGVEKDMKHRDILNGKVVSCGCFSAEMASDRFTKHGGYRTREYKSWNAMIQRCMNPNATAWDDYGGRGISVCEEWLGTEGYHQFVKDMGFRPDGMTLDRIDTNGNYEPGNVRWATPKTQQNNRRVTKMLTFNGETMSQAAWTQRLGMSRNAISERLRKGWTVEQALSAPLGKGGPKRRQPTTLTAPPA